VDFNRAGTPLLEIVSYPDITSPKQAYDYLSSLKLLIQYIGASDCDMEKGSLRCDANISLKKRGEDKLGTKVELKNMNTFKGVKQALEYEEKRQGEVLKSGGNISQETRLWDAQKAKTVVMRSKEEAHDYRYFPDPDLLDFSVPAEMISLQKEFVTELPLERKKRFIEAYGLLPADTDILISSKWLSDFFESACRNFNDFKKVSNFLLGPFLELSKNLKRGFLDVKISSSNFSKIVEYFSEGKINNLASKKILSLSISTDEDIDKIIESQGLSQVSDELELETFVKEAVSDNPKPVKEYLEGKPQAIMFLVGQVMKNSRGKANPKVARKLLENILKR